MKANKLKKIKIKIKTSNTLVGNLSDDVTSKISNMWFFTFLIILFDINYSLRRYVPKEKYEVNDTTSAIANTNGQEACVGLIPIFLKRIGSMHPRKEAVTMVNEIVRDKATEKACSRNHKNDI